ncbi:MAG: alpha/beta hydrolase, partial [Clostridiaceae bacterium]|nr:alpha/beta hydrolase [Clostridiaceae bacterium]
LINVRMQLEDWENAIGYVKKDSRVDGKNLLLFGTSLSGGHVIWLSARRNDVKAAVAQCPYTDTMATIKSVSPLYILKKAPFIIADLLSSITGYHPVMLKLLTYKGENAILETDEETKKRFFKDVSFINEVPARTLLEFVKYSPGKYFGKLLNPVFVAACQKDTLAPADKTIKLARRDKYATYKNYDCGHFDIYLSPYFEEAINDYINFYNAILD